MVKIFIVASVLLFCFSCRQNNNYEERISKLEQQVDSLKSDLKYGYQTDSIIIHELLKPEKGTLLYELEKQ